MAPLASILTPFISILSPIITPLSSFAVAHTNTAATSDTNSTCSRAASALAALSISRPVPSINFTAYMAAHDPFLQHCITPFPTELASQYSAAYLEEASWYNAAVPTTRTLVTECDNLDVDVESGDGNEADDRKMEGLNWRQTGLREGLPPTWEDVEAKFRECKEKVANETVSIATPPVENTASTMNTFGLMMLIALWMWRLRYCF